MTEILSFVCNVNHQLVTMNTTIIWQIVSWHVCRTFKIQLQGLYYSSHHYPHGTHFSNFIGFLSSDRYSLSWLPSPTKSYTPVLRHICLNASIPTFHLTLCNHHPPLTCTSLALTFISVHARFILQLQQSAILSLLLFVRLKHQTLSENILKPIFSSLHLIAPSDLSSASDSFYLMITALNQIVLLTYLLTYLSQLSPVMNLRILLEKSWSPYALNDGN